MGYDWAPREREFELLTRLVKYRSEHGGKWPKLEVFNEWAIDFKNLFEQDITGSKLMDKKNRLKSRFVAYKDLIRSTGLGYNPITDTCTCSNDAWREFVKRHPEGRTLRNEGLSHKDLYYELYERDLATGDYAYGPPSTRADTSCGPENNMSIDFDEEHNDIDEHDYNGNDSASPANDIASSRRRSTGRKRKQRTQSAKVSEAICDIAQSMSRSSKSARTSAEQDPWVVLINHLKRLGLSAKDRNDVLFWFEKHERFVAPFAFVDDNEGRWDMIARALNY